MDNENLQHRAAEKDKLIVWHEKDFFLRQIFKAEFLDLNLT
jgi:hypothetical protein